MLDIKARILDVSVQELLSYSIGNPTPDRLEEVSRHYQSEPEWVLMGYELDGNIVGCIGIGILNFGQATILHLAVSPGKRRQGTGRRLLRQLSTKLTLIKLITETDADAVGFYERCGFYVESLGELYPGVERFRCTLELNSVK